jgi:hypothetical protein
MLLTIAIILGILWLLGMITSYTFSGWIHVLIVVAVVMIILNFLTGRGGDDD